MGCVLGDTGVKYITYSMIMYCVAMASRDTLLNNGKGIRYKDRRIYIWGGVFVTRIMECNTNIIVFGL
jgi:hypothetical protein